MKILMVCLGNICRSPVAEGVLRHKLKLGGIDHVLIDSAGTSAWHEGENPDSRSIQNAHRNGVDISKLVSRPFRKKDLDEFDRIYVMDVANYRDVMTLASTAEQRNKVELFCHIKWPGSNKPVPDPYYSGEDGFQVVFDLVSEVCDELILQIQNNK